MKIWILTKQKAKYYPEVFHQLTRFKDEAEALGVDLTVLCPEDFEILLTSDGTKSLHVCGQPITELPDCVIPRMTGANYFYFSVLRHLEELGVYCLNTSRGLEVARDKLATLQLLASHNIRIPKTLLAKQSLDIDFIAKEFTFPLVLKKLSGSEGKGIVLCESKHQLKDMLELVDPTNNLIIQEFIETSRGRDVRVLVVGGRAIGAVERTSADEGFKANHSLGGNVRECELTPEMEWLAVESARKMDLEMAGIDLLFSDTGYVLCEVNGTPGFKGFELATELNVPRICYEFLRVRLGLSS